MGETWVQSLGWEDPLEKRKATHSSILAWRIPWTVYIVYVVAMSQTWLSDFHFEDIRIDQMWSSIQSNWDVCVCVCNCMCACLCYVPVLGLGWTTVNKTNIPSLRCLVWLGNEVTQPGTLKAALSVHRSTSNSPRAGGEFQVEETLCQGDGGRMSTTCTSAVLMGET